AIGVAGAKCHDGGGLGGGRCKNEDGRQDRQETRDAKSIEVRFHCLPPKNTDSGSLQRRYPLPQSCGRPISCKRPRENISRRPVDPAASRTSFPIASQFCGRSPPQLASTGVPRCASCISLPRPSPCAARRRL